jgi:ribosome biogenesis protein BMS1
VRVDVPRFYNPVTNALVKSDDEWLGMRTVGQIRYDKQMAIPVNPDSIYKPIERKKRVFNKLQIPKALQQALPFKSKPKLEPTRKRKTLEQKRAVVQDKQEKKMTTMVQQLNTIKNEKLAKRKVQQEVRRSVKAKKDAKDNEWRSALLKDKKKSKYREQGKAEKLKAMRSN